MNEAPEQSTPAHKLRNRPSLLAMLPFILLTMGCWLLGGSCDGSPPPGYDPLTGKRIAPVHLIESYARQQGPNVLESLGIRYEGAIPGRVSFPVPDQINSLADTMSGISIAATVDDLATNGFLAVRVPHAPPTYTVSSIISPQVSYSYQETVGGPIITKTVTVARRAEYEPQVNSRYPITDGRSHWEVWWLRPGDPKPTLPSSFVVDTNYAGAILTAELNFPGSNAGQCAGCILEFVLFDGRNYIGPYQRTIILPAGPGIAPTNPLVTWYDSTPCGDGVNFMTLIAPSNPMTVTHCLSNLDTVTRTFTIGSNSLRGLNYQLYSQIPGTVTKTLMAGNQITVGTGINNGMLVHGVLSPTASLPDSIRDTFSLTATSTVSTAVTSSIATSVFGGNYALNETVTQTITFNAIPGKHISDPPFVVSPSSSSGLPVVLSASGPCSTSGLTVTLLGAGTCTVTANQPGDATYSAATPVSRTFTISTQRSMALAVAFANRAGP